MNVPPTPPATMGEPHWMWLLRRIVTFVLGVVVIVDSLIEKHEASVGKLIVGLLLIGVPPLDDLIRLARRNSRNNHDVRQKGST